MVRIVVPEGDESESLGSGTLIHVTEKHGLVITNWHVVQDAKGPVQVVFPDGFRSAGTVMKTDDDWDLAAIGIWRPPAQPLPIATAAPRPGDLLTIAGYGQGQYRAVTGQCLQYVAPSKTDPSQMLELSAEARQGDSGGPILNSQGQLAGVLLGARDGRTVGSYFGRVDQFLAEVRTILDREAQPNLIAGQTPGSIAPTQSPDAAVPQEFAGNTELPAGLAGAAVVAELRGVEQQPVAATVTLPVEVPAATASRQIRHPIAAPDGHRRDESQVEFPTATAPSQISRPPVANDSPRQDEFFRPAITPYPPASKDLLPSRHQEQPTLMPETVPNEDVILRLTDIIGTSRGEQIRSVLAGIGVLSLIVVTIRILRISG